MVASISGALYDMDQIMVTTNAGTLQSRLKAPSNTLYKTKKVRPAV